MPCSKKGQATSSNPVANPEEDAVLNSDSREEVQDGRIVARRADLLRTRQIDLDSLMVQHDDLVREAFHLDKFVTLLDYDPKIARQDNSQVFIEYKAPHDLISKSVAAVASGSTPRKTRRATTELRVSLATTISAGTLAPSQMPSSSPAMAREKHKGAPRAQPFSPGIKMAGKNIKSPTRSVAVIDTPPSVSKGKGKAREIQVSNSNINTMLPPPLPPKRGSHPRKAKDSLVSPALTSTRPLTSELSRGLKRKRSSSSSLTSGRKDSHRSSIGEVNGDSLFLAPGSPPQRKVTIKRVRLFQRPPPPIYTHPSQVPFRSRHGSSIQLFLQSYLSLDDGIDVPDGRLEDMSFSEARTRARIRELKKEGRLLLDIPNLPDDPNGISSFASPETVEPKRREGVYDHLVSAATQRARSMSVEYAIKKNTAKKVAKLVMAWHGNKEGTMERQRKVEVARMKTLAKFTAKEVEKQWKRAVMAVREQNQALLEAEEVRLGRKHLDAILDQSGVILEAQHTDLSRARSRSSSVKDWSDGDGSEADDTDTIEQDGDLNLDIDTGMSNDDADADVSLLLGTDAWDSVGSREQSNEVELESVAHDNDAIISGAASSRDTPRSTSDYSFGTPALAGDIGQSVSATTSQVSMEEQSQLDVKIIRSKSPALYGPVELNNEQDVLSQESSDRTEPEATTHIAASPDADEGAVELPLAPHLVDFAATPVDWDTSSKVTAPFLLRGVLRPYQQSGLEWLASLHTNNLNGILADEMGLGKTIQTIALLAHLACDRGIWGPHLIIVPTSVLLNWEMEFKKFLPGFKILPYHGSTKRRKELRVGWNSKHTFNRKAWYYMILDEAHMIKNFKSQRWNILLMFRSFRRLLLTGTPLQNNLTELWALLQFLMSGTNFANLKEFGDWFSNPLEKAIEQGTVMDEETQERVRKLHTVLRPYLLRRLKADVEKELPSKFDHLIICRLSKRQRFLYDEFMSRAQTRDALASGVYHKVANILMQLRKVCNHPDLFEVRPIVTSFAMPRSATADFEIKELLIRRRFIKDHGDTLNLDLLGLVFIQHQGKSMIQARSTRTLDASSYLPFVTELPGEPPPIDTRTIHGFKRHIAYQRRLTALRQWTQIAYTNRLRCAASPVFGSETISVIRRLYSPLVPLPEVNFCRQNHMDLSSIIPTFVKSYLQREKDLEGCIDRFAFMTPAVVTRDMPSITLSGMESQILRAQRLCPDLDAILHRACVKLQIAFPDASLVQYDCGKLQELASLLRAREAGGHRVLIFTQMTRVLDILEVFLNFHGYRYLRLDGATRIEDRQYITERFNTDARVFAFIASSRSGGVGINLTGADTVIFYDSDFNPQMDRQCEDRAHRIGQIRDVHIYRFISEHTVEESMLRKANQKRSLDNIVIQQGEFDWRSLLIDDEAFGKALGEFEDREDAFAARVAAREEAVKEVEDHADFAAEADDSVPLEIDLPTTMVAEEDEEKEGTVADYMLAFVNWEWDWFSTWRI